VTLNDSKRWKHSKFAPFVFTEQGVAMLSSVLNSQTAIQVNISIMRIFVKMRQWAANYEELVKKIDELQEIQTQHNEHIANIYRMIEELDSTIRKYED
jgi:septal ring factor EnvC (AmiA/AmiB activator)